VRSSKESCFDLLGEGMFSGPGSPERALAEYRVELIEFMRRPAWARAGRYPIMVRAQTGD
jgi:hypothetical protein